jgi:competence protein ComEC
MSDLAVVALAAAAWLGSLAAAPVPRLPALVLVVVALVARRPWLLVAAAAVLASSLGAAAWRGLDPPATSTHVRGAAILVSDPEGVAHATRVEVRLGHRRVEAWARGAAAAALDDRLAGDVVVLDGWLRDVGRARARLAVRHIGARLDVRAVVSWRPGPPAARAANAVRRTLTRGAQSLAPDRRALLAGFLLGDQRDIAPTIESDFRGAGLTHLLAVSGLNVR